MHNRIKLLPETLTHRIAAGEVVERPASIVKELLENSLDAGATEISLELEKGGCELIRVIDNGSGIEALDVPLAFARHATSKISEFDDLYRVRSFGFRGEALASIASVSRTELVTRTPEILAGMRIVVEAGKIGETKETGCPVGTAITVSHIFDSVPVRKKFLKTEATERAYCLDVVTRLALAHPEVRIRVLSRGRELFHYPASPRMSDRIALVLGTMDAERLQQIEGGNERIRVYGFASRPDYTCATTRQIYIFINRRYVKDYLLNHAVMTAYRRVIEPRRYPAVVLYVDLDPTDVDVNVHPAKLEVRFRQPRAIYEAVVETLSGMLRGKGQWGGSLLTYPAPGNERTGIPSEEYESRVAEGLRRYRLASGSRKLLYGTVRETVERRKILPEDEDKAPASDLFSLPEIAHPNSSFTPIFSELAYLGTLWNTYLIFPAAEGMILVDQHAAHERILYEKMKEGAQRKKMAVQTLLLPEVLGLAKPDIERFTAMIPILEELGIEAERFGADAVIIRALPVLLAHLEPGSLVKDLLSELSERPGIDGLQEKNNKIYALLACKGAVKAGQQLTAEEVKQLCRDLDNTPFAATCPHGRPVYILYTVREIERMFRRT